ncbi:MAG TPA: TlpA disulfide reductase family protein [Usitatibacter sp.]|nr:TlpA disulfide reductase family protein [Usitatibacter sp.]
MQPLSARWLFTAVGLLAFAAGAALWLAARAPAGSARVVASAPSIAPAALLSTAFVDSRGVRRTLAQFPGKVVVLNFWATWCAPCREEMPAFTRLQGRWASAGVQFVGISAEDADKVERFGRELGINYPLWSGGDEVREVSRRLGNQAGVLPHTVILGPGGEVLDVRVGAYSEPELEARLGTFTRKS